MTALELEIKISKAWKTERLLDLLTKTKPSKISLRYIKYSVCFRLRYNFELCSNKQVKSQKYVKRDGNFMTTIKGSVSFPTDNGYG